MGERRVARAAVQPAGERSQRLPAQRSRLAGEIGENALRDVAGKVGRIHLPQRGGKDEIRVARDQFAESGFVAAFSVVAEQFDIGSFVHLNH